MMFLPQPITKLGVFEAETVDAALTMCADAFPKIEREFKATVDFATFKFQLLKTMGEFLYKCAECPHECLKNPRKHVEEERYIRNHIKLPLWPKRMQKNNAENFFSHGIYSDLCRYPVPLSPRCGYTAGTSKSHSDQCVGSAGTVGG